MKLANNAMLGCMFVNDTNICKHIMFTVQASHHGTSIGFHFHVRLKPLCYDTSVLFQLDQHQPKKSNHLNLFVPDGLLKSLHN